MPILSRRTAADRMGTHFSRCRPRPFADEFPDGQAEHRFGRKDARPQFSRRQVRSVRDLRQPQLRFRLAAFVAQPLHPDL